MTVNVSITDDDVFTALRTFLLSIVPAGVEVIQTQDNGVPIPIGPFVSMNNIDQQRLSTNTHAYDRLNNTQAIAYGNQYTMQVDCFGPDSGAWATAIQALFRDAYGYDMFPANIKPLHADGPTQLPLMNAESNYEQRWRVRCVMHTNPNITVPQQYMESVKIDLYEVDHAVTFEGKPATL